jgi:uncharacterized protein YutE (UPF0331/DUF86 family)
VTRDVLARKLHRLRTYLGHLQGHVGRSAEAIAADPFEVERLLELVVQVSVDILNHELASRGVVPESYRDAFVQAGKEELLPEALAATLARSAGLRNVLVHAYEEIDYELVAASVPRALDDLTRFLEIFSARLDEDDSP